MFAPISLSFIFPSPTPLWSVVRQEGHWRWGFYSPVPLLVGFICCLIDGWLDGWIYGSPHTFFLLPSFYSLFSYSISTLSRNVTGPLVIEGLVSCGWKSYRSLTLGFTGVFYSFAFGDFVVVVVFKRYFCA